jgi:aspartate 1-decarboxylase
MTGRMTGMVQNLFFVIFTFSPKRITNNESRTTNFQTQKMLLQIFKSKIHRATVTQADLNYVGSITIDETLMEAADLYEGERVQIVNNNNGERFETYVIRGERDSGVICLNGAAARKVCVGDIVIIMSYALMTPDEARVFRPMTCFPDANNRLII